MNIIIGHRGYKAKYPENTLLAFKKSFELCDGIECDLQKTKDNKYVFLHDETIDRTSNGKGKVNELTLNELKKYDFGNGERILELEEFLKVAPQDKLINIELKDETITDEDCDNITNLILKYLPKDNIVISSFEPSLLPAYKAKGFKIGYLVGDHNKNNNFFYIINTFKKIRADYLNLPIGFFTKHIILEKILLLIIKILKIKTMFWTVNTEKEYNIIKHLKTVIITNEVEKIVNLEKNKK